MAGRRRRDPRHDHVDPRHDDRQRRIRHAGRDLHSSIAQIQWVASGYLLSLAAVIPITGWAARRFGAKRVYMVSLVLFTSAQLCARWQPRPNPDRVRVLQGVGGGMIMPLGAADHGPVAGPQRMGRVIGSSRCRRCWHRYRPGDRRAARRSIRLAAGSSSSTSRSGSIAVCSRVVKAAPGRRGAEAGRQARRARGGRPPSTGLPAPDLRPRLSRQAAPASGRRRRSYPMGDRGSC